MNTLKIDDKKATAEEILARRYRGYNEPLLVAWKWNRSSDKADWVQAEKLLLGLSVRYANVIHVWYELAFNRSKQASIEDVLALVQDINKRFDGHLDEDTYCLWGSCYKKLGNRRLDEALLARIGSPEREIGMVEAERFYAEAANRYGRGYESRQGFFACVNVATLTFLRATILWHLRQQSAAEGELAKARTWAEKLLASRATWKPRLPDDDIWMIATEGEAEALLERWDRSAAHYREALRRVEPNTHYPSSMGAQLRRIFDGYRLLEKDVTDPLRVLAGVEKLAPFLMPA